MKLKKWILNELDLNPNLVEFTKKTLLDRFESLKENVEIYLNDLSDESLHKIRISLRRVRYSLEVFYVVFEGNKKYQKLYDYIGYLQDLTGKSRDLDVMREYLSTKFKDNKELSEKLKTEILRDKQSIYEETKKELEKFLIKYHKMISIYV